jgi:hypothetical protein
MIRPIWDLLRRFKFGASEIGFHWLIRGCRFASSKQTNKNKMLNQQKPTKMKKLIFSLLLMFSFAASLNAQDIITFKNGSQIKVKIIRKNEKTIHYYYFDRLQGPEYFINVDEVSTIQLENQQSETINLVQSRIDGSTERIRKYYNGPRIGFTYISESAISRDLEYYGHRPYFTMMGWQFESRFFHNPNGSHLMFEFVPMIGGLEQGLFLPSANFLLGYRSAGGFEFGLGPNFSPSGTSMLFSIGKSFESHGMVYPANLVFVPGYQKAEPNEFVPNGFTGNRVSLIFGFNTRR